MSDDTWMRQAQCLNRDPDWWDYDGGPLEAQHKKAIATCGDCPVRLKCLRAALDAGHPSGIWGGLTPRERDELQRRLKLAVRKVQDTWTVTYQNSEATAPTWATAMSFANTVLKGTA
jgi:hypothetical protein